jgi:hypothetical protein
VVIKKQRRRLSEVRLPQLASESRVVSIELQAPSNLPALSDETVITSIRKYIGVCMGAPLQVFPHPSK